MDGSCEPISKLDDLSEDEINALKQIGSYDKQVKHTIYEADGCYIHGCVHIIKQRVETTLRGRWAPPIELIGCVSLWVGG